MNMTTESITIVQKHIDSILPELISIRHDIHAHPELGYEEHRTNKLIQQFLLENEVEFEAGLAKGTGVLGNINGEGDSSIALRADIDALPIIEENNV